MKAIPRSRGFAVPMLLCLVWTLSAAAAPSKEEQEARALYKQAQGSYDLGQFEEALKGFSAAYQRKELPGFLFNIAQCHRQLGNHERAIFFYRRYLDLSPKRPKNADQVEELIAQAQAKVVAEKEAKQRQEEAARRAAELEAQRLARVDLTPKVAPKAEPVAPAPSPAPAASKPSLLTRWWVWAGVGALAAGVVAGAYVATAPTPRTTDLGELSSR